MEAKNNKYKNDMLELVGLDDLPPEVNFQVPDPVLLQYYTDRKDRIIHLDKDIGEDLFNEIWLILQWNREDEKENIPVEERIPIKIFCHSYGGQLDTCFALIDVMSISKTPIYTYNMNACMSAGAVIYINGHKRFAMPKSTVLFHQGEGGAQGGFSAVVAQTENYKKLISVLKTNILEHTSIPKTTLDRNFKKEWYVYLDEQLKYGITDYVITDINQLYKPTFN